MSDVMLDESTRVDTFREGDWESAVFERAFILWCIYMHSGTRVEFVLQQEVLASTVDGEPIPAVPSAQTINGWARQHNWERRELSELAGDLPARLLRIQIGKLRLNELAIDTAMDVFAGKYDGNEKLAAVKAKLAEGIFKMVGMGAFGANQGGLSVVQAQELMMALGERVEDEALSEKEKSRRNREAISASKRGE